MPKLVAIYDDIEFSSFIIAKCSDDPFPVASGYIGDYEYSLEIKNALARKKKKTERIHTSAYKHAKIVIKKEDILPPPDIPNSRELKDCVVQQSFFDNRRKEYGAIACTVINNAIKYFKYSLNQPLLKEFHPSHDYFTNPSWEDINGNVVGTSGGYHTVFPIPGLDFQNFGTITFKQTHVKKLTRAIENSVSVSLVDDIIYDAQSAIFVNNYRRAVFELAQAAEIMIKQKIFGNYTTAGLAFEFLENKGRVNCPPIELIHKVSEHAMGRSFHNDDSKSFQSLKSLFECRNKIAHRGTPRYVNAHGDWVDVDQPQIQVWWDAFQKLVKWLR
jgi:hypothetical protein